MGKIHPRFARMNSILCELIDDFSLVSFQPLDIQNKESVYNALKVIDKANGYVYGSLELVAGEEGGKENSSNTDILHVYSKSTTDVSLQVKCYYVLDCLLTYIQYSVREMQEKYQIHGC